MKDIKILDNLINKAPEGLDLTDWVFCMNIEDFDNGDYPFNYKGHEILTFNVCPKDAVYFSPTPIM